MYQYSLNWFISLYEMAIKKSKKQTTEPTILKDDTIKEDDGSVTPTNLMVSQNISMMKIDDVQASIMKSQLLQEQESHVSLLPSQIINDKSLEDSQEQIPTQSIKERVKSLIKYFNYSLYSNVCRSIFEKDKLLFSFLLTMSIKMSEGKLGKVQFNLLIENMTGIDNPLKKENPYKWL
jgi:hypothetical protein